MKSKLLTICFFLLFCFSGNTQPAIVDFSDLSGNETYYSEFIKHGESYYLLNSYLNPEFTMQLYRISEQGIVLDSINIRDSEQVFFGNLRSIDDKLYLGGIKSESPSQRYIAVELESDFSVVQKFESPLFDTLISPSVNGGWSDGTFSSLLDFTVFEDTFYILANYLLFDTLNMPTGSQVRYFKATLDGNVLIDQPFNGLMFNAFFRDNQMYFQGSNSQGPPGLPTAVGLYNENVVYVNGWNFDNSGSGEWPWGAYGGTIDDKLYFSYLGRDASLSGCSDNNVAIDVRDTSFNILHRFKIEECEYLFAGNMPFAKAIDGNIYFQAIHKDFKKFIIKKFTPDMSLIWSQEYDFSSEPFFTIPMELVPAEDGGMILHCREEVNGFANVRLYKITPDGVVSSSNSFSQNGKSEPSVLSPNPCVDKVQYMGESTAELGALIYGIDGRIRTRRSFENSSLNMVDLPNGLYSVLIFDINKPEVILHRQTVVKVQ